MKSMPRRSRHNVPLAGQPALRDLTGKIRYAPVAEGADRAMRDAFSDAMVAAVEREHPDAFSVAEAAS
jgi:hypothetical protein